MLCSANIYSSKPVKMNAALTVLLVKVYSENLFFWHVIDEMFELLPFLNADIVVKQLLHTFVTHFLYKIPF